MPAEADRVALRRSAAPELCVAELAEEPLGRADRPEPEPDPSPAPVDPDQASRVAGDPDRVATMSAPRLHVRRPCPGEWAGRGDYLTAGAACEAEPGGRAGDPEHRVRRDRDRVG